MNTFQGGFAILMCVYANDDPVLFSRAIDSVRENTLAPNQIVIVVDGPIPDSLQTVLQERIVHTNTCLDVYYLEKNVGFANALNFGLMQVHYEWVVRADADDINIKDRFEKLSNFLTAHPECDLVGSYILEVDHAGQPLHERRVPLTHFNIIRYSKYRSPFNHMSVAFRKKIISDVGGYPNIYLKEDYALWSLLLRTCVSANIPEILVHATAGKQMYRRRGGLKYVYSEAQLQKFLYTTGCKNFIDGVLHFILRSIVFSLPPTFRGFFYANFLRSKFFIPPDT